MQKAKLLEILSAAETELRAVIEQLLRDGAYGDIATTARIADAVAQLKIVAISEEAPPHVSDERAGVYEIAEVSPPSARRASRSAKDYPKFSRDGDKLIKTAWSKRDRAEYEHRTPRRAVELLIEAIVKKKGEGRKFEAGDILPVKDPTTRKEIPSYQSYMALGWLRAEGLVTKKGRNGYVLKNGASSTERLNELWEALPIHQ